MTAVLCKIEIELTELELNIIKFNASGKKMKNDYKQFNMPYGTLAVRSSHLITKLGANNIIHAVAIAHRKQIIGERIDAPYYEDIGIKHRWIVALQHLADGKSFKEISKLLNISMPTVSCHTRNIKPKIGTNTTAESIYKCMNYGYIK